MIWETLTCVQWSPALVLEIYLPAEFSSNLCPIALLNSNSADPANQGLEKRLISWSRCGRLWLELDSAGTQIFRTRAGLQYSSIAANTITPHKGRSAVTQVMPSLNTATLPWQWVCLHALSNPIIIGFLQLSDYSNGHANSTFWYLRSE